MRAGGQKNHSTASNATTVVWSLVALVAAAKPRLRCANDVRWRSPAPVLDILYYIVYDILCYVFEALYKTLQPTSRFFLLQIPQ